ncbi:MAG: EF-hand domain-containing protein [Hyphomonadaceae bacterium]|nr:EF-hand domain-containing protein [Hyphomonadaceae bacterium]
MHTSSAGGRKRLEFLVLAAAFSLVPGHTAFAQTPAVQSQAVKPPVVQPAIDGILAAFKTRPLVGMSDRHGIAQQQDFYAALVRDPRFAREVGNVVVEFGSASHQGIIDRYVAGEDVPYAELRKVWSDVVGWNPTVTYIGFVNVFLSVRAANLGLPPDQRIKVWLGEPPVDWTTATKADVDAAMKQRDSYPADLIVENILKKNRKALVIYGGAHLTSDIPAKPRAAPNPGSEAALRKIIADTVKGAPDYSMMTPEFAGRVRQGFAAAQADLAPRGAILAVAFKMGGEAGRDVFNVTFANGEPQTIALMLDAQGRVAGFGKQTPNLRDRVEERYPNSFFIVWPHSGNGQNRCTEGFESNLKAWPTPALATSVRGSSLEGELRKPDCHIDTVNPVWFDGFLYLGPVATLLRAPSLPDLAVDPAYRAEISRRQPLRGMAPLPATVDTDVYTVTPRPWQTNAPAPAPTPSDAERMVAFKTHDRDNDGKLDKAAYKALLETLGFADQVERLFAQRDVNKDGFVSAEEYRTPIQ